MSKLTSVLKEVELNVPEYPCLRQHILSGYVYLYTKPTSSPIVVRAVANSTFILGATRNVTYTDTRPFIGSVVLTQE